MLKAFKLTLFIWGNHYIFKQIIGMHATTYGHIVLVTSLGNNVGIEQVPPTPLGWYSWLCEEIFFYL